ncbi:AI-2E family transporter [Mangrovibacterium sp.]|uniref:AI-2E family transporter n=1 Tax=Mangrovibacterium sp. TaxID=1961364 RepID=UPI00356B2740
MKNPNPSLIRFALVLFCISVTVLGLVLAKDVLIPLVISVFLAYLIYPMVARVENWGVHRGVSIVLVILVSLLFLSSIVLLISIHISTIELNLSQAQAQVNAKTDSLILILESKLGMNSHSLDAYVERISNGVFASWESQIGSLFSATTTTVFQLFILPVYTFFLLFYRTKTAHFILRFVERKDRFIVVNIMREVSLITTRYMGGLLIVVVILAILNTVGLAIIGVPHAMLFGIAAAILNLIPYIGTFVGGIIPILFVFFSQSDPFHMMVQILVLFTIVQFLENNLITPGIVGNNIKINPFAIVFSLLMANLIWGVAGMFIVLPFLAIAKVIMRNVDSLKPFAYLISDKGVERHKVGIKRLRKWVKRKAGQ